MSLVYYMFNIILNAKLVDVGTYLPSYCEFEFDDIIVGFECLNYDFLCALSMKCSTLLLQGYYAFAFII